MAIIDSASRLLATFIATIHTRAALVAIEVEEEALRYFSYLMLALGAMFCGFITMLLAIFLIVAMYWDTHRIGVLATLIAIFGGACAVLAWTIISRYRHKPQLLGHTLSELSKDVDMLKVNVSH